MLFLKQAGSWASFWQAWGYSPGIFIFIDNFTAESLGFPDGSDGKGSACNLGNLGSILGLGRSPGEGNGNPLQYSCLENYMDRGLEFSVSWWATVHVVEKSRTRLSDFHFTHSLVNLDHFESYCFNPSINTSLSFSDLLVLQNHLESFTKYGWLFRNQSGRLIWFGYWIIFLHDTCEYGALVSLLCLWWGWSVYPHIIDSKTDTQKRKMTIVLKVRIRFKCLCLSPTVLPSPFPAESKANMLQSGCSLLDKINFLKQWSWGISLYWTIFSLKFCVCYWVILFAHQAGSNLCASLALRWFLAQPRNPKSQAHWIAKGMKIKGFLKFMEVVLRD